MSYKFGVVCPDMKHAYDDETIKAYLLGTLAPEATEQLDELSVSDDQFVDLLVVVENDLVDAYVQGELSSSQVHQFKSSYLTTRFGRQKVDFAQSLQQFAAKRGIQRREASAETSSEPPVSRDSRSWFSGPKVFGLPRWAHWGIASAVLLLFLGFGWWVVKRMQSRPTPGNQIEAQRQSQPNVQREQQLNASAGSEQQVVGQRQEKEQPHQKPENGREPAGKQEPMASRQQPSPPRQVTIASFVLTPQMRGIGEIQTISFPAETTLVAVKLQLEPDDYTTYRVVLLKGTNQALWRSHNLKAKKIGNTKTLEIEIPAGLLDSQTYSLQVQGLGTGKSEILNAYPFKLVKR
jgi:hypothetical protein